MSLNESKIKIVASTTIPLENYEEKIITLLKNNDVNEYYLSVSYFGWKQISEIQRNLALIMKNRYWIVREVVPLIYYLIVSNPEKIEDVLKFLLDNQFAYEEQDEEQ